MSSLQMQGLFFIRILSLEQHFGLVDTKVAQLLSDGNRMDKKTCYESYIAPEDASIMNLLSFGAKVCEGVQGTDHGVEAE